MKKFTVFLMLLMGICLPWAANGQRATYTLLTENFDQMSSFSTSYTSDGWYAYNAGDGNNWVLGYNNYSHSGAYYALYVYDSDNAANCYLVSPAFLVSADMTSLNVSLYELVDTNYPEEFEVFFVRASDVYNDESILDATQHSAIASSTYNNYDYAQLSGSTTSPELADQWVRLVIHCTSAADQDFLAIDDIVVTETTPGEDVDAYCTPGTGNVDGEGIYNVTFGTGGRVVNNTVSAIAYGDYSSQVGAVEVGTDDFEVAITYKTGYTYGTIIWVDWDDSYSFEGTEVVYAGTSTNANPTTLTATFDVPLTAPLGDHRMRIIGSDMGLDSYTGSLSDAADADPCGSYSWSTCHDYTLRVTALPTEPTIRLAPVTATILINSTQTLTATTLNADTPTITYTSSSTDVATVSGSGTIATVTGVSAGTATITATMTCNGVDYTATCDITVEELSCEDFEDDLGFWTVTSENTSYTWARKTGTGNSSYTSAGQGSYNVGAYYNSRVNAYTYLTLNADLSSYYDKKISFKYINPSWQGDIDFIYLQYTTDGTEYTDLASYTEGADSWTQVTDLAIPDEAQYIRFAAYGNYGYGAGLDEICLDYSNSSCPPPTGLFVSALSAHGANVSWDKVADTVNQTVYFQFVCVEHGGTPDWTDAPTAIDRWYNSNLPYGIFFDLAADTEYDAYIRRICGTISLDGVVDGEFSDPRMITFTTEAICPAPTNVTASDITINSAHISWDGNADSYNVQYATATVTSTTLEEVFFDDFESGFGNWTTYALGDYTGNTWELYNGSFVDSYHSGSYGVMTRSYYNSTNVCVDNWLVSPQMTLGDVLKFWVVGDNNNYQEYFAVYVSTGTNAVGDFEFVEAPELAPGDGTWAERTVDLSAYAGQQGYIAIRHTDCAQDFLILDDFGVYNTVHTYSYGTFTTLPPTSETSCDITGLNPETLYVAQVQADCGDTDGTSRWNPVHFTTPDACSAPTDLVASDITLTEATLSWADNQDSYNVQYRKVHFFEGFEGENLPTGWTTINANEDGYTWGIGHATTHSGNNGAASLSYDYGVTGTTPDDYLVSPLLDLQGTLRVWLSGITADSYAEHFEILLSTTDNSVEDFTITLVEEAETTNEYVEYTADLSSYEGQQGYIAIHHFNCTDQRYLYVDDFGLYGTEDWVPVTPNPTEATVTLTGLSMGTGYEWQVQGIDCDGNGSTTEWSDVATFTTKAQKHFVTEGDWNVAANWRPVGLPMAGEDVFIDAAATIPAGYLANVGHITLNENGAITMKDGGQLRHTNGYADDVTVTIEKDIIGYGERTNNVHYYFIAPAPFNQTKLPTQVNNMLAYEYDLYNFDPLVDDQLEWINYKNPNVTSFKLRSAHGYLYANSDTITLSVTGPAISSTSGGASMQFNYNPDASYMFKGWRLAGNTYLCNGYVYFTDNNNNIIPTEFYQMNETGDGYNLITSADPLKPFEGVFVYTENSGIIKFSPDPIASRSGALTMNLSHNGANIDMARVRFGEGQNLAKRSFRVNSSKIYMPVGGKDYATVFSTGSRGEMPVSFKAEENGSYTLSFSSEAVSFSYLHLIDTLTGAEIDLLQTPTYTFEASAGDNASRFKLVFATDNVK